MKLYTIALIALCGCCFFISCNSWDYQYKTRKIKGVDPSNLGIVKAEVLDTLLSIGDTVSVGKYSWEFGRWVIIK